MKSRFLFFLALFSLSFAFPELAEAGTGFGKPKREKRRRRVSSENSYFVPTTTSHGRLREPGRLRLNLRDNLPVPQSGSTALNFESVANGEANTSSLATTNALTELSPFDLADTFPVEVIYNLLMNLGIFERFRLCTVSSRFNELIQGDRSHAGGILLGTELASRIIPSETLRLSPRRFRFAIDFSFFRDALQYHFSQAMNTHTLRSSLSPECPCHGVCLYHNKWIILGESFLGGRVVWVGYSPSHSLFFAVVENRLFIFGVEPQVVEGLQPIGLPSEDGIQGSYSLNAPIRFIRTLELPSTIHFGVLGTNILYLVSRIAGLAWLIDLKRIER